MELQKYNAKKRDKKEKVPPLQQAQLTLIDVYSVLTMLTTVLSTLHRYLNLILTQLSEKGIVSIFRIRNLKLKKFMYQIERGHIQTLY